MNGFNVQTSSERYRLAFQSFSNYKVIFKIPYVFWDLRCVNHIYIRNDIIPRLQFFIEKIFVYLCSIA